MVRNYTARIFFLLYPIMKGRKESSLAAFLSHTAGLSQDTDHVQLCLPALFSGLLSTH